MPSTTLPEEPAAPNRLLRLLSGEEALSRPLRLGLWLGALLCLVWIGAALLQGNGLQTRHLWLLSAAVALLIMGWAIGRPLVEAAFWLCTGLLGQATALQLVDAGTRLHYQHYLPPARLLSGDNWPLALYLLAQTLLVVGAVWRRRADVRAWLGRTFRPWQVLVIAVIVLLPAAAVSEPVSSYAVELPFAAFVQALNLATLLLAVCAIPDGVLLDARQRLAALPDSPANGGGVRLDRLTPTAALAVTVVSALLCLYVYQVHPHITDEVAYLYQARFFAAGTLTLPAPAVPEAFDFYMRAISGDRWFLPTPPGWPALLAVGVRLGVPWLVNPLLAGLNLLLSFRLLRGLYGRREARLAVLLLAVSPWYVFMAMNFMTHTFSLTCALLGAVAINEARRPEASRTIVWAAVAGVAVGLGVAIRQLDGVIAGGLLGLWALGLGGKRLSFAALATFVLVSAATAAALLAPFNMALGGSPTTFPLNAYLDQHFGPGRNDLGFGPNRGFDWQLDPFPGHSPLDAIINANLNIFSINIELFGWSIGSLLFIAILLVSRRFRRGDYLMLAACAAVFTAYFFYYFSGGPDFGARYWYLMIVPGAALSARGVETLRRRLQATGSAHSAAGLRVYTALAVLVFFALVNYFPWRAVDKYYHLWGLRPDVPQLARQYGFGRSLVLVRGSDAHLDYASAAIYNPLDWQADAPLYARDLSPETTRALLAAYPDRPVWVIEGPSITHGAYRVLSGPQSAAAVLGALAGTP